jgi:capsule polysaccharide export protein KpsE/RkpR
MIFKVTVATAVVVVAVSLMLPNSYSATALLLPAQEDKGFASALTAQLGGLADLSGDALGGVSTSELYVSMLKSETIKDPIINRFKLKDVYGRKFLSDTYAALDSHTSVSAGKKDGIITITVEDKDPKRAAALANAYVEELKNLKVQLNTAGAAENRMFLGERLATAKADLAQAEEELKAFQIKNKSIQMPEQVKASISGIAELKASLALKEAELSTVRRSRTETNQQVKNLKTLIANMKSQIARLESGTGGGAIPAFGSLPQIGQDYARLMREFKTQENIVELMTKQFELAKFSEAKYVSPFQVLQIAKVPERKSKPQRAKLVLMAAFAMGFFSIIAAFFLEYVDKMPESEKIRWEKIKREIPLFCARDGKS